MPKLVFIRHAEPDKDGNITKQGAEICRSSSIGSYQTCISSELPRSQQTLKELGVSHSPIINGFFNEWDKENESDEQFKKRVEYALTFIPKSGRTLIVGHARFMNWAYWLLKGEPTLGFDYLEGFEHEF